MQVTEHDLHTFRVSSESGREPYLVDLAWREEPWHKPKPLCGCERSFCHGELCKHIRAVVMIYSVPNGFKEVSVDDFEQFLKECADYYRDSYSGCSVYFFRHNNQQFAIVKGTPETVWVDPSLLKHHETPQANP